MFHLALFAYLSLANILPGGFPGRGLEAFHFEFPPVRVYWPELPIGIWPVLEKGLKPEARDRYPTTVAFLAEFQQAASDIDQRVSEPCPPRQNPRRRRPWHFLTKPLGWLHVTNGKDHLKATLPQLDIGHRTIAGIAKDNATNQDAVDVFHLAKDSREVAIAIVADGVSTGAWEAATKPVSSLAR